jgi:hypothetical protein
MNIEAVLNRLCVDICVYWGSPVNDGEGGFTFNEPKEIACRWENMDQIVSDKQGTEITSRAVVYVLEDLDEEGMLFLGTLDYLYDTYNTENSEGALPHPKSMDKTYFIKRFQKTPSLGSTSDYLRKAYLTPSLSFGGF